MNLGVLQVCVRAWRTHYSLFCESDLHVHNCKSCRQCIPAVFQQESSLASEATQAEVWLEPPRSGASIVPRDSHRSSEVGLAVAVIKESPRQSCGVESGKTLVARSLLD